MSKKEKLQNLLVRTCAGIILALVIIPAYFYKEGIYLYPIIRLGFLLASLEMVTVSFCSKTVFLNNNDYATILIVWIELFLCNSFIDGINIKLIGGCIFICVITDVVAYLVGNFVGGKLFIGKPFPNTSPNKSFEGLYIGGIAGLAAACIWYQYVMKDMVPSIELWKLLIVVPCAIYGDYIESRFKRIFEVKDSNDFLIDVPVIGHIEKLLGGRNGHGGFFDRLDSLAFVIALQILLYA